MKLKDIYKASQCTDLSDVSTAIEQLKALANGNYTPAMRRRLASLEKRKQQLS